METAHVVGIPEIDAQHSRLFQLCEELQERLGLHRVEPGDIEAVRTELVEYFIEHFRTEEALMDAYEYPQAAEHRNRHVYLIGRLTSAFVPDLAADRHVALDLVLALNSWFKHHVKTEDDALARYVRARQDALGVEVVGTKL